MKRFIALIVIALVMVVILSCVGSPASGRPESTPTPGTATLWLGQFGGAMYGSGFPPLETVDLYLAGELWKSVSVSNNGTFAAQEEFPSTPEDTLCAFEAFVGDELWATHPWIH